MINDTLDFRQNRVSLCPIIQILFTDLITKMIHIIMIIFLSVPNPRFRRDQNRMNDKSPTSHRVELGGGEEGESAPVVRGEGRVDVVEHGPGEGGGGRAIGREREREREGRGGDSVQRA